MNILDQLRTSEKHHDSNKQYVPTDHSENHYAETRALVAYAKAAYPFPELKSAADPLSCPLGAAGLVSPST
jgi:hypothetical protein